MIPDKEKLFLIFVFWEQPPRDVIWKKLFIKFTFKGKRYMELRHFFFSSTLSGIFKTLINIYDGANRTDS